MLHRTPSHRRGFRLRWRMSTPASASPRLLQYRDAEATRHSIKLVVASVPAAIECAW